MGRFTQKLRSLAVAGGGAKRAAVDTNNNIVVEENQRVLIHRRTESRTSFHRQTAPLEPVAIQLNRNRLQIR